MRGTIGTVRVVGVEGIGEIGGLVGNSPDRQKVFQSQ